MRTEAGSFGKQMEKLGDFESIMANMRKEMNVINRNVSQTQAALSAKNDEFLALASKEGPPP